MQLKLKSITLVFLACILTQAYATEQPEKKNLKPRIVVLTDIIGNDIEPDDMESMVRLLVHADQLEIEALIATTGWNQHGGRERLDIIHEALNAYEKDLPNLKKRSDQKEFANDESKQKIGYWPSPNYLRSKAMLGSTKLGMKFIGEGNDSKGSDYIIKMADEKDDRPIWIGIWGGGNTFAQAIWRVQKERTPEQLITFLRKFRVYAITDQDRSWSEGDTVSYAISSHQWMRKFEKDLMFLWDESAWKHQNDIGRRNWDQYALHIQKHGNLGNMYPKYKWGVEGDTPAFLHVMPTGLSDPNIPTQVSWSGYFEFGLGRDNLIHSYTNHTGEPYEISTKYFKYFYPAIFNNFAARMDWAKDGKGNRNPVVIINGKQGIDPIEIVSKAGKMIKLNASKTYDPDGNNLCYKWWVIAEAGTYSKEIEILNNESSIATIYVPSDSAGKKFHVICEVTDDGVHNLTSYRRIIFEPK